MKKIYSVAVTVTVQTKDEAGNIIDTVTHVQDNIDATRPGIAVNADVQSVFKTIKMGFDRLASKLYGQMEIPNTPGE